MERFRKISSTASGLNIAEPVQFFSGRTSCVCKPSAMSRLKFGHFLPLSTAHRIEPLFHAALGRLRFPDSNLQLGLTGISSSAPLNWRELKAQPDSRICTAAVHGYHKPYLSRTRETASHTGKGSPRLQLVLGVIHHMPHLFCTREKRVRKSLAFETPREQTFPGNAK